MAIRIVTDSTCDLPEDLVSAHGITVTPLYINMPDRGYLDGVEITRAEFYGSLPQLSQPPKTASPGPDVFQGIYERLAGEGADQIISIHISVSLSSTVDVARMAAGQTKAASVTVVDSRQLSMGTGFLALTAAKAAQAGKSLGEILALLESQTKRSYVFAALDTLEFLARSGRMSWTVARLGRLLRIKPILTMHDGQPGSERARTSQGAMKRVVELLASVGALEQVALVHTFGPERIQQLREMAAHLLPAGDILEAVVTPVIGAHIGPEAVGFACVAKG